MDNTLKQVLVRKKVGAIIFDENLEIVEWDPLAGEILGASAQLFRGKDLLDVFPEFIGVEGVLRDVLDGETEDYRLDYVNRTHDEGWLYYLDLLAIKDEKTGAGLLLLEDSSEAARMRQELNQQRYDLLLYQNQAEYRKRSPGDCLLGESPAIEQVRGAIEKLSKVPSATILLQGETGAGKNHVARLIHYAGPTSDAPFVEINCAALPESLIESELFGYEKGAFTSAASSRQGLFQEAGEGGVLLDEIGELPLNLQAKLLSVLETRKFRKVGGNKLINVKARVSAATNRDLKREVAEQRFREDLFYRLNVVSLTLPPLRDLDKDVLIIADHFVKLYNLEFKKRVKGFTKKAKNALLTHHWPGNIRELSNCIERAMIFTERINLDVEDLIIGEVEKARPLEEWTVPAGGVSLEEVERQLILSALKRAGSNTTKAARLLNLSRDTLRYRMDKFKIKVGKGKRGAAK
ncbi:MAG: AAA domain-containing protein [Desulfobacterales bacterium]|nr:AAA domain-containing protein [Desulfobacterales bacterium]